MDICLYAPPISRPHLEKRLSALQNASLISVSNEDDAISALASAVVLVIPQQYTTSSLAAALNEAPNLRMIQLLTAGLEKLRGVKFPAHIRISSGSGGLAPIVAEHAVALLLALTRRLPKCIENQRSKQWDIPIKESMVSLFGKTVAVVGFGAIGREVASHVRVFGARVVGVSGRGVDHPAADKIYPVSHLDEALSEADIIVLALPSTPSTQGLFDAQRLAHCRPGAFIVNVGRGSAVDTVALAEALNSGHLGGAAIDVTDPEPLPKSSPLWSAPNLIVTPHCAAGGGYAQLAEYVANNILRLQHGEEPRNLLSISSADGTLIMA